MNLNTIQEVRGATAATGDEFSWQAGDSWLAGGTWLFSEPQAHLTRLLDLRDFNWPALEAQEDGLQIAPTCTIAQLYALQAPADWRAAPMIGECCRAFLASFKIWNTATVGGNICMSLPAGPMISLTASLDGVLTLQATDGSERHLPVTEFVTGNHQNVLQPGELMMAIHVPAAALRKRAAFRRSTLTHMGRSTALLIGTAASPEEPFTLTITAATPRPVQLTFPRVPEAAELRDALHEAIPDAGWFEDVHGTPDYRKHMSHYYAEQIRAELVGAAA